MKHIFSAVLLTIAAVSAHAADMVMPIRGVADGDTIQSSLKLPCPLCNVSVRILGIDTPETSYLAKCVAERARGLEAKKLVQAMAAGQKEMTVKNIKWDKYGGRINGHVFINGVSVGDTLIAQGLARPYTGLGPKSNWCN